VRGLGLAGPENNKGAAVSRAGRMKRIKIGRYEIEDLVGEGAMAKVYRARDPEIDRVVAIKLLRDELCVDEEYVSRFIREAQAAGSIQHPNIVTIYDVGRLVNTPYITMEFLDEKTLAEVFASGEKLPVSRVLSIGVQLASALDHAHKKGIVHRDVKPSNVLLLADGETVKITDFGIARRDGMEEVHTTQVGMVVGTPRYMSPEQAAGGQMDGRSDLFSLGVLLYELLTGKQAFESDNVATLMLQILQREPTPIRNIAPDVPPGVQKIVAKLLQKRPERRFQTGAQLAEALERERAAIVDQEEHAAQNKFIPLRLKWACLAAAALTFVFAVSMAMIYSVEARVVRTQALDSGSAIAKFIATETAIPVLSKNWVPLEIFVQDAGERGSFDFLVVTDHQNMVKASTDKTLVGKPFTHPSNAELVSDTADIKAFSVVLANGNPVFLFDAPILFQKTEIGRIRLGLNRSGMDRVLESTLLLMSVLGLLTVIAVFGMVYIFGGLLSRPIRLLRRALIDFGAGDFDRRVPHTRKDEIGQLFHAFNHMADHLQARFAKHGDAATAAALERERMQARQKAAMATDATMLLSAVSPERKNIA
jgi:eukaryotic-like serine/threonine-protein kinase